MNPVSTICIHQPDFAPYIGFFHRLLSADHFVILDDAQFIKGGWQNRDRIKNKQGSVWLTLSIVKKFPQLINQVMLSPKSEWINDNLNLIKECYSQAKFFEEVFPQIEKIYRAKHDRMIDLNIALLELAFDYLEIEISISYASEYAIESKSNERLVEIVKKLQGTKYLTGTGSKDYLDEQLFNNAGISVEWQKFKHPIYPQLHGEFEPMLSCLDLIFNCGRESAAILRSSVAG